MAAIAAEKTWEVFPVMVYGSVGAVAVECRELLYGIKAALVSGTAPWVVKGSSNSVAAGMDDVDRWLSASNIVGVVSTGVHSWIVFELSSLDPGTDNVQVCIDVLGSVNNGSYLQIFMSPAAGFTGGSTSARPTATDEGTAVHTGQLFYNSEADASRQAYVCKSTDGQCTRIYSGYDRIDTTYLMFDRIKNPHADIARPYYAVARYSTGSVPSLATVITTPYFHARLDASASTVTLLHGTTYILSTTSPLRTDSFGAGRDHMQFEYAFPVGLFWPKAAPYVDHMRVGKMFDFWMVGAYGNNWEYLKGVGGAWRIIRVGDGFAQPGNGSTVWWR